MNHSVYLFLILLLFFCCCKKKSTPAEIAVKIAVVSGNNQTDTAGRTLPNQLEISVTRGGQPVPKAVIKILQTDCSFVDSSFVITDATGMAAFPWQLNGHIGTQTVPIFAIDSLGRVLDSTSASATGLFFDHVWIPATCLPRIGGLANFVELPNGRILRYGQSMYYSDDSGRSWSVLSSFPQSYIIFSMAVYGNNLFTAPSGYDQAMYYSKDNGSTWQTAASTANMGTMTTVSTTASGKLFLCASNTVYLSTDLGQTWKNLSAQTGAIGYDQYYFDFCEAADGTMYTVNEGGEVWVSYDGATSWRRIPIFNNAKAVFSDATGVIYISTSVNQGQIYKMAGSGTSATWSVVCSFTNQSDVEPSITNIMQAGSTYYFTLAGYGFMKTSDFVSFKQIRGYDYSASLVTHTGVALINIGNNIRLPVWYNTGP